MSYAGAGYLGSWFSFAIVIYVLLVIILNTGWWGGIY
jgi:hypothetical protein